MLLYGLIVRFIVYFTEKSPQPRFMIHSKIAGIGKYLPERIVTNKDLLKYMDTTDEWIRERTGIEERRYAQRTGETTTTMAVEAAKVAIERAGITPQDIDFIIFFWDPLQPAPHDPDVKALLRLAVVWNIPVACNQATADFIIHSSLLQTDYQRAVPDFSAYLQRLRKP